VSYRVALPLAIALVVAACSANGDPDGGDGPGSATIATIVGPTADTPPADTPPAGATQPAPSETGSPTSPPSVDPTTAPGTTEPTAPTTVPPPRVGEPVVAAEAVGEFDQPVDLAVRPGDDRLYIVEQPGRVVRVGGGETTAVLDLTGRVSTGGEQGLLGLAFSPDGSMAYVDFTDSSGDTVVAEFAVDADGRFDPSSERTVIVVDQPFSNHNAGDLEFGPDGMLFITLGDGGSGGDPQRNGSNPATLLGSLLRIDPTPSADAAYTIPAGNPGADDPAIAQEVWSWGLRNPWKIAFDPVTGQLWIADVGQNEFEEINVVAPTDGFAAGRGLDFGWSAFEGVERFDDDVADTGSTTLPVLTYSHADGCSISGGVPYRGTAIPELEPAYVYSDYCTSTIWALDLEGGRNLTLLEGFDGVSAVRAGPDDELYVLERSGTVHRLTAG
jgi:glucose/arabinose dehydrogenase